MYIEVRVRVSGFVEGRGILQGEEESKVRDRARGFGEEGSEREECRMVRRDLVQGQGLGILIQC